jgi:hypothetical protein
MNFWFKLVDRIPVPCSREEMNDEWAKDRHVGLSVVGDLKVSTVFMPLNHAFNDGPPVVFETMIFGENGEQSDDYMTRCCTWGEAEAMHAAGVAHAEGLMRKKRTRPALCRDANLPFGATRLIV